MTRTSLIGRLAAGWTLLLLMMVSVARGRKIDVVAGKKECFFEDLHKLDKV